MRIKVNVQSRFNPREMDRRVKAAERAVALQAEKDTRPFVPRNTGGLAGRTEVAQNLIIYRGPGVRSLYFGKQVVDPKTKVAGFPIGNSEFRSRAGVRKVLSNKEYKFKSGTSFWFRESKRVNIARWRALAKREVAGNGRK